MLVLLSAPAQGMVYMWHDSAGIAHYTNKEYNVPSRYKTKVKTLYPEASDSEAVQPGNTNAQAAPVAPPPVIANQNAGPGVHPVTLPPAQIQGSPPRVQGRGRKHRARISDEEE